MKTWQKPDLSNMRIYGCAAEVFVEKVLRNKSFGPSGDHSRTGVFLGYARMCKGYGYHIPKLDQVVIRKTADFDEGHLPYSVGETSIAKPNTTPGIKLDATPIDKIKNIPTMASPASVNSGGKPTTKPQSSGGTISIKPTSIIRLTGKTPTKTYIKKRLSLIGGLTVAEALEISCMTKVRRNKENIIEVI